MAKINAANLKFPYQICMLQKYKVPLNRSASLKGLGGQTY